MRFIFTLVVLISFKANSQDVHFSQFYETKALINPALAGYQEGDYKVQMHRKSQWESVSIPFNTFSFAIEVKEFLKDISIGIQFLNDIAGDSKFRTNGINLVGAKKTEVNSTDNISIGFLLGAYQRLIDFSDLVFNDEEIITNQNINFIDLGIGIVHEFEVNTKTILHSGISIFHLNKPNQSLLGSNNIKLPVNSKAHASLIYYYNSYLQIKPSVYSAVQGESSEFIYGTDVNYLFSNSSAETLVLRAGIFNRNKDAIISRFGIKIDNFDAMVSYDINTSSLNSASNSKGGFEFSVSYQWSVSKPIKSQEIKVCPKYL
tara:strand:- start:94 stop:1047 length:954 start_codon:yes stop_codon:yes gene_type:complete